MQIFNSRNIPQDRLTTTDEKGNRVYIHPADVQGKFKNLRIVIHAIMILIFLVLPFIQIKNHPAILLDIAHRKFAIFGITFWAHDAPLLLFIFGGSASALAFITAIWGRIWCGWACPQTVFIEQIFRRIERWIEGDSIARRKLDQENLNFEKVFKKLIKWFFFLLIALVITHSFLAYFVGAENLLKMMQQSPSQNFTPFLVMSLSTALILFDFGWFREQFCTIVCPYGRFQSVLLDSQSLVITYDEKRGEPRRDKKISENLEGDCVNCYRCVEVCPTGIDIRNGIQMECIACTACIDACDTVMKKLDRPLGLIRYDSIARLKGRKNHFFRSRTLAYLFLLSLFIGGLGWTITHRQQIEAVFVRSKEAPYQQISTSEGNSLFVNHYKVDLSNQSFETMNLYFQLEATEKNRGIELVMQNNPLKIEAGKTVRADLFIKFPKNILSIGKAFTELRLSAASDHSKDVFDRKEKITLVGPSL